MASSSEIPTVVTPRVFEVPNTPPQRKRKNRLTRKPTVVHVKSKAQRRLFDDDNDDVQVVLSTRKRDETELEETKRRRLCRTSAIGAHEDTPLGEAKMSACIVCRDNEACIVTLPCRHMVMCARCTHDWFKIKKDDPLCDDTSNSCPKCRKVADTAFLVLKDFI